MTPPNFNVPKTKTDFHSLEGQGCRSESEAWYYFNAFEQVLAQGSPQISVEESMDEEGNSIYTPKITWGSVRPVITQEL